MRFASRRPTRLTLVPRDNPEDALEPALRAVLEATDAAAAAVCLFDALQGVLRLTAEIGLSAEGCRNLRKIGLASGWVVPLESLLARRRRSFARSACAGLPTLLEEGVAVGAVSCIPLHADDKPRASVILVAASPDTLRDEELEPALADLARVVEAIGRRGAEAAVRAALDPDAAMIAPATLERLKALGDESGAPAPEVDVPRDLLPESSDDDRDTMERAHGLEIEHLAARLAEAERACARERSLRFEQELRSERARKRAEAERDATVRRAREFAEAAEQLRASTVAEAEAIRAALAEAQRLEIESRDAARRASADAEHARAAETAANEARQQMARALDDARAAATEAGGRRGQLEAELGALAAREAAARAREAEAEARWSTRLAEAELALEAERKRLAEREAERLRLSAELEETLRKERRVRLEVEEAARSAAAERDQALHRGLEAERSAETARMAANAELEALRLALAEAQKLILDAEQRSPDDEIARCAAEMSQRTEEARVAAVAELEATRAALAETEARLRMALGDAARGRDELQRVAADRDTAREEAARLAEAVETARSGLAAATESVPRLEAEVRELHVLVKRTEAEARMREADAEARALAKIGELDATSAAARARIDELEADIARREQALGEARARETHARELLAVVTEDREGVLAHVTGLARAAEEARAAAVAEAEAIRGSLGNAQVLIIQAEDESRRARADAERQEAEIRALQTEREQLEHGLREARARVAELEGHGRGESPPESPPTPVPPRPTAAPVRAAVPPGTGSGVVAVIGGSPAFGAVSGIGCEVTLLSAEPGVAESLAQSPDARVVVNLAIAGGLDAVGELRDRGFAGPVWGCLAAPDADVVVPLGMIETTPRTLETEPVLAILARHAGRGARLLAIGAPANNVLSLRQAVTREGISMSIAWDAKQAHDLLPMVRPDVVIVDLAQAAYAGHRMVARLASLDPRPVTIILPSEGGDASAGFLAAFAECTQRGGGQSAAQALRLILDERPGSSAKT